MSICDIIILFDLFVFYSMYMTSQSFICNVISDIQCVFCCSMYYCYCDCIIVIVVTKQTSTIFMYFRICLSDAVFLYRHSSLFDMYHIMPSLSIHNFQFAGNIYLFACTSVVIRQETRQVMQPVRITIYCHHPLFSPFLFLLVLWPLYWF